MGTEKVFIDGEEYTSLWPETKQCKIYYHHLCEDLVGYLSGADANQVLEIEKRINNCTCGARPELHEFEGMGDGDYWICCKSCGRELRRSPYDADIQEWEQVLDFCIRDWNDGLLTEDIEKVNQAEYERIRMRDEDIVWKELYPNNMEANSVKGYYALVFAWWYGKLYCCKWTIEFQYEEIEPMHICDKIEAYNLFMKMIFEVKGPMSYPEPIKKGDNGHDILGLDNENTFTHNGVNSYGDFIRSYRTLEEAKIGAVERCGWQGINRDTIIRADEYEGKTAEQFVASNQ